jgi:hypothetical protein
MVNTAIRRPLHPPEEFSFDGGQQLAGLALGFQRFLHALEFEALSPSG